MNYLVKTKNNGIIVRTSYDINHLRNYLKMKMYNTDMISITNISDCPIEGSVNKYEAVKIISSSWEVVKETTEIRNEQLIYAIPIPKQFIDEIEISHDEQNIIIKQHYLEEGGATKEFLVMGWLTQAFLKEELVLNYTSDKRTVVRPKIDILKNLRITKGYIAFQGIKIKRVKEYKVVRFTLK